LLNELKQSIQAAGDALSGVQKVFLFGSALRGPDPRDVDLLVVYDPSELAPADAVELRVLLAQVCAAATIHPLDVVLLTGDEARDTDFAARESAELIFQAG
jgi:predicted nucleotidyltransferase